MGVEALILLDNSLSVGRGNLAVCRETIRYLADNAGSGIDFALSVYGEDIGMLSDFGEGRNVLKERLDSIELIDRETYLTDNLAALLLEWKKADFADRCIILFSDGEDAQSINHEKGELYFLLAKLDYPVYAVQCVNDRNAPIKNLSAVSTISSGELLFTEFEDSEAAVEKKLGDKILSYINARYFIEASGEPALNQDSGTDIEETEDQNTGIAHEADVMDGNAGIAVEGYEGNTGETVYNYESVERLAGNEMVYSGGSLKPGNENYIYIPGIIFFLIIAITIIRLIASAKKGKKAENRAGNRKNRVRRTRMSFSEEPTERLADEARSSGDTMLLFADEI
ncbi:MAG: VWA domain-containing protein [Lachnospiraceae bacterium]|nr:VWA domain-containing protein [Lachnospiraceae bacterium]